MSLIPNPTRPEVPTYRDRDIRDEVKVRGRLAARGHKLAEWVTVRCVSRAGQPYRVERLAVICPGCGLPYGLARLDKAGRLHIQAAPYTTIPRDLRCLCRPDGHWSL